MGEDEGAAQGDTPGGLSVRWLEAVATGRTATAFWDVEDPEAVAELVSWVSGALAGLELDSRASWLALAHILVSDQISLGPSPSDWPLFQWVCSGLGEGGQRVQALALMRRLRRKVEDQDASPWLRTILFKEAMIAAEGGQILVALPLLDRVLEGGLADLGVPPERLLPLLARLYMTGGQPARAATLLEQASTLGGEGALPSASLVHQAALAWIQAAEPERAASLWEGLLEGARAARDRVQTESALRHLGLLAHRLEQPDRTVEWLNQAIPLATQAGLVREQGMSLRALGIAHRRLGQWDASLAAFAQLLPLARQLGDDPGEAMCFSEQAETYGSMGAHSEEIVVLRQAIAIQQRLGQVRDQRAMRGRLARALGRLGAVEEAISLWSELADEARTQFDIAGMNAARAAVERLKSNGSALSSES